MDTIIFHVRGIPKPQPRPRSHAVRIGKKMTARIYEAGTAEAWKADVIRCGENHRPATPLEGPIRISIYFYLPRPKKYYRKKDTDTPMWAHEAPADIDNLMKSTMDAMTTDSWWRDDKQVVSAEAFKMYHSKSGVPGATIMVRKQDLPTCMYEIKNNPSEDDSKIWKWRAVIDEFTCMSCTMLDGMTIISKDRYPPNHKCENLGEGEIKCRCVLVEPNP